MSRVIFDNPCTSQCKCRAFVQFSVKFHKFDANFKVACAFRKRTYNKLNSFTKHLTRKHGSEISELGNESINDGVDGDGPIDNQIVGHHVFPAQDDILQRQSAKYLLSLKSDHNMSERPSME